MSEVNVLVEPGVRDVKPPDKSALMVRMKKDGTLIVENLPDRHMFSARWIDRMIGSGHAKVTIEFQNGDKTETYELDGFLTEDNKPNFTGWVCDRSGKKSKKAKGE